MAKLESAGQDLLDEAYFSQEAQTKRMDEALQKITKSMDDRLSAIMGQFDDKLDELKNLGAEFPSFEEWEEDFNEEEWRRNHPEEAAELDSMFGKVTEEGYLGDVAAELEQKVEDKYAEKRKEAGLDVSEEL